MRLKALLLLTILRILMPVHASATAICEALLSFDSPAVVMQKYYPGEEQYYWEEEDQRANQLKVCQGGCLSYIASEHPFNSVERAAILVVGSDGAMYGNRHIQEGVSHHSTTVAGQEILFAGEVTTAATGKVLHLNYRSGHYPHGPFRLKVLIDDLGGPDALADATVYLSDVDAASLRRARQPKLSVRDFYSSCHDVDDTGDDVLLNYLMTTTPDPSMDHFDFLEPMMQQSFQLLYDETAIRKYLLHHPLSSPQSVVEKMVKWIEAMWHGETVYRGRVVTAILNEEDRWRSASRAYKREFFAELLRVLPEIRAQMRERGVVVSGVDLGLDSDSGEIK